MALPHTDSPTAAPSRYPSGAPSQATVAPTEAGISCNESVTTHFSSGDVTTRYLKFIVSESGYDVTFSNCKTSYDTRLDVYNEDKSVTISYTYCDGDDCGYSGFPLCVSYNSNEAFTIPSMDAGTYYIGIRYNDTLYFERYYRFVLETTTDVTFSNCDTLYDTRLNVYDGLMASVSYHYCDGDDCGGCSANERFTIPSMSDGLYYVETKPYSTVTTVIGSYVLEVSCATSSPTTVAPTSSPTTAYPTQPTAEPVTRAPTEPSLAPTRKPTDTPTTGSPTSEPTR
eukprot:983911_1